MHQIRATMAPEHVAEAARLARASGIERVAVSDVYIDGPNLLICDARTPGFCSRLSGAFGGRGSVCMTMSLADPVMLGVRSSSKPTKSMAVQVEYLIDGVMFEATSTAIMCTQTSRRTSTELPSTFVTGFCNMANGLRVYF